MNYLNNVNVKQQNLTLGEIRHMVRDVRNEFNVRIYDASADDVNVQTAKNLISSGAISSSTFKRGKLFTNKPIEYMNKQQAIQTYNDYVRLLNADTTTPQYRKRIRQKDIDALKRFNKARVKNGQTKLTMIQFQQYSNLYDKFSDLFDGEYYRDIIDNIKEVCKKFKGKRAFMDFINDAQEELGTNASNKDIYDRAVEKALLG